VLIGIESQLPQVLFLSTWYLKVFSTTSNPISVIASLSNGRSSTVKKLDVSGISLICAYLWSASV
jgi:hypothetical protein